MDLGRNFSLRPTQISQLFSEDSVKHMSSHNQVRLQFLEEARDYLQTIESGLLGISSRTVSPDGWNEMLRAAHSIKGGAALMEFHALHQLAHRLEDFFKVLRCKPVIAHDPALEKRLLFAVDLMGQVAQRHQTLDPVDPQWCGAEVEPTFDHLYEQIGDPDLEAEASLLSEESGDDMCRMLFETEVDQALERLEQLLQTSDMPCLLEEFQITAQELGGLGEMLELPAFSSLCQSIETALSKASEVQILTIAQSALQDWRRSQALVLVGQPSALPNQLAAPRSEPVNSSQSRSQINSDSHISLDLEEALDLDDVATDLNLDEIINSDDVATDLNSDETVSLDDIAEDVESG